jgi:hypothetical protein
MKELKQRPAPRYITALWVVMAHFVAITALLLVPADRGRIGSAAKSIQLLYVAPVHPPKVPNVTANLPRAGNNLNVKVDPPVLTSLSFPAIPTAGSAANGEGSGVDWNAEARRALQAFEIRNHQSPANKSVSGRPEDDRWRPGTHYAGERFKNADGDWIVWLNANCYEIASAAPGAYARIAPLTEPVCSDPSGKAAP